MFLFEKLTLCTCNPFQRKRLSMSSATFSPTSTINVTGHYGSATFYGEEATYMARIVPDGQEAQVPQVQDEQEQPTILLHFHHPWRSDVGS